MKCSFEPALKLRWKQGVLCFAISMCFVGCSPTSVSESPEPTAVNNTDGGATDDDQTSSVELKLIAADQYAAELAARKGKVLLIDMWTTW